GNARDIGEGTEETELDSRRNVVQAPGALGQAQWPVASVQTSRSAAQMVRTSATAQTSSAGQTLSTIFDTVTGPTKIRPPSTQLAPDTQAAVGPSQIVLFLNGKLKTYTQAGVADGVLNANLGAFSRPNRVMIAVSDAASNGVISGSTVWKFYKFQADATRYADYPSLGIDANALYIGASMADLPAFTFNTS